MKGVSHRTCDISCWYAASCPCVLRTSGYGTDCGLAPPSRLLDVCCLGITSALVLDVLFLRALQHSGLLPIRGSLLKLARSPPSTRPWEASRGASHREHMLASLLGQTMFDTGAHEIERGGVTIGRRSGRRSIRPYSTTQTTGPSVVAASPALEPALNYLGYTQAVLSASSCGRTTGPTEAAADVKRRRQP